jgi:hypothetical protein
MEPADVEIQVEREAVLLELAVAYQRRELAVFEAAVRPDMTLTLGGSSRLAGTYVGYDALRPLPRGLAEGF